MSEFDLINRYFKTANNIQRKDVLTGIGDDCALLSPPPDASLAISTDTLIAGVHFPLATSPQDIGYKALAVNLSDLAAMGATPAWVSLAITLPQQDECWLKDFMGGFNELAKQYNVQLIGGDTTKGSLSITVNVIGFCDKNKALLRSQAKPGDIIGVTGFIGDAGAGLKILQDSDSSNKSQYCVNRLNRPTPRLQEADILKDFSVAAIDISDGLVADLQHICNESLVSANVKLDDIPLSKDLLDYYEQSPDYEELICAGDDYELCFCCRESEWSEVQTIFKQKKLSCYEIGRIVESSSHHRVNFYQSDGRVLDIKHNGYNHFIS